MLRGRADRSSPNFMSKPLTESLVQNNGSQKELQTPENSPPSEASWEKGPVNWSAAVGLIDEHTEDKVPDSKDSRLTKLRKAETSTIWGRPWDVPASVTLHHPPGEFILEEVPAADTHQCTQHAELVIRPPAKRSSGWLPACGWCGACHNQVPARNDKYLLCEITT